MLKLLGKLFGSNAEKTIEKVAENPAPLSNQSAEQLYETAKAAFDAGDSVTALDTYLLVLKRDPRHLKALVMLGFLYKERGNHVQAKTYLEQAIQIDDALPDANYLLGSIAAAGNDAAKMQQYFRRSLALDPKQEHLYLEFAFAQFQLGQGEDAIAILMAGLHEYQDHLGMLQYLGNIHLHLKHYSQAYDAYLRAIAQQPNSVELRYNQVIACMTLVKYDEALEHLMHIQTLQPEHVMANFEEGMLRLQRGEYERGWRQFQWRWKTPALAAAKLKTDKPIWDGSQELKGKTILVLSEQGFGDTIQFCRFIPQLKQLGAHIVFVVVPPLLELMKQVEGVDVLISNKEALPHFDFYCELMSLPIGLKITTKNIPLASSYLSSSLFKRQQWEERIQAQGVGLRVGIVWSGNVHHTNNHMRSIPYELMRELFCLNAQFTILQKEISDAERVDLTRFDHVHFYGDELGDFTDSAALVDLMDVVITVDTSIAHLAGAMGKPTWVLLSFLSDWRWLRDTENSPWYDSVRLFRQGIWRPWTEPIEAVKHALQARINVENS